MIYVKKQNDVSDYFIQNNEVDIFVIVEETTLEKARAIFEMIEMDSRSWINNTGTRWGEIIEVYENVEDFKDFYFEDYYQGDGFIMYRLDGSKKRGQIKDL